MHSPVVILSPPRSPRGVGSAARSPVAHGAEVRAERDAAGAVRPRRAGKGTFRRPGKAAARTSSVGGPGAVVPDSPLSTASECSSADFSDSVGDFSATLRSRENFSLAVGVDSRLGELEEALTRHDCLGFADAGRIEVGARAARSGHPGRSVSPRAEP